MKFPSLETIGKVPVPQGKANQHPNVLYHHCFHLCRRNLVSLGLCGNFLKKWGYTMSVNLWENRTLMAKFAFFSQKPKMQPRNCLKIHGCFLTSDSASFAPSSEFLNQVSGSQSPAMGPLCGNVTFDKVTTLWHPLYSQTHIPTVCFLIGSHVVA